MSPSHFSEASRIAFARQTATQKPTLIYADIAMSSSLFFTKRQVHCINIKHIHGHLSLPCFLTSNRNFARIPEKSRTSANKRFPLCHCHPSHSTSKPRASCRIGQYCKYNSSFLNTQTTNKKTTPNAHPQQKRGVPKVRV